MDMKKQLPTKMKETHSVVGPRKVARAKSKITTHKLDRNAQMTNYLLEEHPELGK
jgi:hypothetical protein